MNEHPACECPKPTGTCPRYGWMKGRRWEHCQGIRTSAGQRNGYLDAYQATKDHPEGPNAIAKALNYAQAMLIHAMDGLKKTTEEEKRIRLEICGGCDSLNGDGTCSKCGCPVEEKADLRSSRCPLKKWPGDAEAKGGCGCG